MTDRSFSAGEAIFREGEFALTMYEVQRGSVGIVQDYGTQRERELTVLKAGQLFGEMGLVEAVPRSATAVAKEDGTLVREITEEEFYAFFQNKPELLLQLLKQLSARIRENTEKYREACQVLRRSVEAEKSGAPLSEALSQEMTDIGREAEKKRTVRKGLRSAFYAYVQEDLAAYEGKRNVVRASLFERLAVRALPVDEMHVNPEDEFADPEIGPSDRIISEYAHEIPQLWMDHEPIFRKPVCVYKIQPEGYLLLNGHHRWAAALKSGLGKIRAVILNPPK